MADLIKRDKCPWKCVGENTVCAVYWCQHCGCVVDEDGTNLGMPQTFQASEQPRWCNDVGYRN